MRLSILKTAGAAMLVFAASVGSVQAATIVNVSGGGSSALVSNASKDGANAVDVALTEGTYQLSFVDVTTSGATYTAFSRFGGETCASGSANCARGWENSVRYIITSGSTSATYYFGDGNASGGGGPISGGGYFQTAAGSFANALAYTTNFTLAAGDTVKFFLYDDIITDNRGGVSLSISAVPLPAAAWLFGSALLGLVAVARRKAAV